jgi:ATP-dependent DNA ligase
MAAALPAVDLMHSRKGNDLTARFPKLVKALSGLKPEAFSVDGEVAL